MTDTKTVVIDFLNKHRKAVFATATKDMQPHASLMLYAIDEKLHFYFGTRKSFGKFGRLMDNPKVSLSVVEGSIDPLRVVEAEGSAKMVSESDMKECLEFFESKNPSPYYVKDSEDFVMFKIIPTKLRWLDATSGELKIEDVHI